MTALFLWVRDSVRVAGWAPVLVFAVHMIASRLGGYRAFPELDTPMHFAGGVAIAYFCARSLRTAAAEPVVGRLAPLGVFVVALALVSTSTVVWESAEWTTDRLGWTRAQAGLDDTMIDVWLGLLGGVVYLAIDLKRATNEGAGQERSGTPRRTE